MKSDRTQIIQLRPICIKRFGLHRAAPNISPQMRLDREVLGARLLRSVHVDVVRPILICRRHAWLLRRWHPGFHPSPAAPLSWADIGALGAWLGERRHSQPTLIYKVGQEALLARWNLLSPNDNGISALQEVITGCHLLHGDLVAENLVRSGNRLHVLDPEAVSIGHIAWDAACLICYVPSFDHSYASRLFEAADFDESDRELTWRLVSAFQTGK